MARGPSARVVINRAALDKVILAAADGMGEAAKLSVEVARPPDAAPYGQGLPASGGWLLYAGGKKIAGGGLDGRQPKKPRAANVGGGIVAIAGFGFPARFQEFGTAHHGAQPFGTAAMLEGAEQVPALVARSVAASGVGKRP